MGFYWYAVSDCQKNQLTSAFGGDVYYSNNFGTNWVKINPVNNFKDVSVLKCSNTHLFSGLIDFGLYYTSNNGTNWTQGNISAIISNSLSSNNISDEI